MDGWVLSNVRWTGLMRTRRLLVMVTALLTGCHQYRSIPVAEASKLSHRGTEEAPVARVTDVDGDVVLIEEFLYVDVKVLRNCKPIPGGKPPSDQVCDHERARYYAPVEITQAGSGVTVVPSWKDPNYHEPATYKNVEEVQIVAPSASRPFIIVGVAVAAAIGAWAISAAAVEGGDNPYLGLLPFSIAAAAGGLSIAFTAPLTRGLGEKE